MNKSEDVRSEHHAIKPMRIWRIFPYLREERTRVQWRYKAVLVFTYVKCCHLKKKFVLWHPRRQI